MTNLSHSIRRALNENTKRGEIFYYETIYCIFGGC